MAMVNADQLHRLVKLALDTGQAATVEEAERLFAGYRLALEAGPELARSSTLQAGLLTAVNTGRRCFLGGVEVSGNLSMPLLVPWRKFRTLAQAVADLGGKPVGAVSPEIPRITIGTAGIKGDSAPFAVGVICNGWTGGVIPLEDMHYSPPQHEFTPAGVLAGALAVSEAFQFVRGDNAFAGKRSIGASLWQPENSTAWLGCDPGPRLEYLPAVLWLIGLGHLGQAYLWTLGLLPYFHPDEVQIILQDFDDLVQPNDSTSLLTNAQMLGVKKTRAMALWCGERGLQNTIVERRFAANFRVDGDEPKVAVCGVDNALARADLEEVGFARIVEAGLGKGSQEYLSYQMHTFPASRSARQCWGNSEAVQASIDIVKQQPAYQALASAGYDDCGLTLLAGRSVGAPFVGAATSAFVVAELIRMAMGAPAYEVIDGDLRTSAVSRAIVNEIATTPFNPGSTLAIPQL